MNLIEQKAMCDAISFIAMINNDDKAHINLPQHVDQVNRHYETFKDLCGKEVAEHFRELINRRMTVCRIAEKW